METVTNPIIQLINEYFPVFFEYHVEESCDTKHAMERNYLHYILDSWNEGIFAVFFCFSSFQ